MGVGSAAVSGDLLPLGGNRLKVRSRAPIRRWSGRSLPGIKRAVPQLECLLLRVNGCRCARARQGTRAALGRRTPRAFGSASPLTCRCARRLTRERRGEGRPDFSTSAPPGRTKGRTDPASAALRFATFRYAAKHRLQNGSRGEETHCWVLVEPRWNPRLTASPGPNRPASFYWFCLRPRHIRTCDLAFGRANKGG